MGSFITGYCQCENAVAFKCNGGRELKNGVVGEELPFTATLSIAKRKVVFTATINGEANTVSRDIKDIPICSWTDFLQNGKAQYKADLRKEHGDMESALITIESLNGKTKITCSSDPDTGTALQLEVVECTLAANGPTPAEQATPVKEGKPSRKKAKAF
ncbi:hypothetical protein SAMN05444008_10150 [Cnuella takakiae]|uniref:Uncharacterized protein n=2 Tax=Cnuella takakiae TaxID=1302690 RepID=A0A1M4SAN9_9BACT|nr:hypothetical protein BUE76_23115 [Cnuella takakiae]SHE29249.1 hypothetical protein SAMN05444008_10150 [Cnuella takakiae]